MQQTVREQNMRSRIAVIVQEKEVLMMLQKNLIYTQSCDLAIPDNICVQKTKKLQKKTFECRFTNFHMLNA